MKPAVPEPALSWIESLYDDQCGLDANHQHLKYCFEGYRAGQMGRECPYSPGSARALSWNLGNARFWDDSE